ncbi:MAG: hypothetical protein U0L06_09850, partial [Agathobacter sp.]|nr:hypothetical protein [Agathobacter sp.]
LIYHIRRFAKVTSGRNFAILSSSFGLNGLEFNFSIQPYTTIAVKISVEFYDFLCILEVVETILSQRKELKEYGKYFTSI